MDDLEFENYLREQIKKTPYDPKFGSPITVRDNKLLTIPEKELMKEEAIKRGQIGDIIDENFIKQTPTDFSREEQIKNLYKNHQKSIKNIPEQKSVISRLDEVINSLKGVTDKAKLKSLLSKVPVVAPIALGLGALSTGDAGAAVGDFLTPGGAEGLNEGEDDMMLKIQDEDRKRRALEAIKKQR